MIVPMNRLTVLLPEDLSGELLARLQHSGAVEIEELAERDIAAAAAAASLAQRFSQAEKTLISSYLTRMREGLIESREPAEPLQADPLLRLEQTEAALEECEASYAHQSALEKEIAEWEPWGEFDPIRLRRLSEIGVKIRLLRMTHRVAEKEGEALREAGGALIEIGATARRICFLSLEGEGELPAGVEELPFPEKSLSERKEEWKEAAERGVIARRQIAALYDDRAVLRQGWKRAENEGRLTAAALDLRPELEGRLISFTGWLPESKQQEVETVLKGFPVWFEIRPPTEEEEPPVRLHNRGFARLFEPIATLHSLPRYRELDPVPYFSVFFAFFVGCCLGDAAYGALVLTLALIARKIAPASLKPLFSLLAVLGGSTIFCGTMFNSFFGESLPLPAWLTPLAADMAVSEFPMMALALVAGFIQILFAMGLRAYSSLRYKGWKDAVEPISYIFLTVGALIWAANTSAQNGELLGLAIHNFNVNGLSFGGGLASLPIELGTGMMIAGTLGIFLFCNAGAAPVMRYSFLGAWSLYNYVTKIISDALSYLRLFALGLAGGLLAASFNTIAMMLVTDGNGVKNFLTPLILGTLLILVVGHALNMVLAFIGGLVHPLRLTFVEFYSNMDYQGGGRPFRPLSRVEENR